MGLMELMTGAGQFSPSVMSETEHSAAISQLFPHHPHMNPDPRVATHSEQLLARARQSYRVTVCVCEVCECGVSE